MKYAELVKVKKQISDLIPNVRNPRKHPEPQIEQLKQSIDVYGFAKGSVVIQKGTNKILAGHGILSALKAKGFTEVDVIEVDLTDDLADAFLIADNRFGETSEWDIGNLDELLKELDGKGIPADYMGFDDDGLKELMNSLDGGYQADEKDDDVDHVKLADRFIVPPFSVLDARAGYWQDRKRAWIALGIKSELGRGGAVANGSGAGDNGKTELLQESGGAITDCSDSPNKQDRITKVNSMPLKQDGLLLIDKMRQDEKEGNDL